MSGLIVAGIILIAGVNWLYSRFCEEYSKTSNSSPGSRRRFLIKTVR
ncbi:MAG: hypothetical protein ACXWFY_07740 [Chthoniobacterales bacterium]